MIGAEDVDQRIKAALDLVEMIGDIGGEIGPRAVRFHHRPVHVIPVFGGFEQRLLARLPIVGLFAFGRLEHAFIDQPLGFERVNRRFDPACAIQRFFRIEHIHFDA